MNKKRKYIIILISLFFIFTLFTELRYYSNRLDFLWNYNFGSLISNGLLPYNDFNIVTTPLLAFIVGLFLKIFGNELLVYAIIMAIGKVSLAGIISKMSVIISKKKDEKEKIIIFTISFLLANLLMFRYYFEYNYLSILFLILIIYFDQLKTKKYANILIGILASLATLSKYSVGGVITFFILIEPFIFKEEKSKIWHRLIGVFIPLFIFLIYLITTNSFYNFISYTILGLKEFSNNINSIIHVLYEMISVGNFSYAIIYLLVLIISFYYLFKRIYMVIIKKKKVSIEEKKVLFYSLSAFSCFYPIMDDTHLAPSILPLIILESNSIYKILKNNINKFDYRLKRVLKIYSMLALIFITLFPLITYIEIPLNINKNYIIINDEFKHLRGLAITKSNKLFLEKMIKFEQEEKGKGNIVKYLDKGAVLFHIPQDIYYKDYDLFMRGNFGENGENRLIDEIKNSSNTIYLIKTTYKKEQRFTNNQTPEKVIDYVINNYKNNGKKLLFYIYSK